MLAIVVAIVLVAWVSMAVNQSWLLSADILKSGGVNSVLVADIRYTTNDNMLTVYSEKTFNDAQSLTFMIVYSAENVTLDSKAIQTAYDYTSSSGKDGVTHVTVFLTDTLLGEQEILKIPFMGNHEDVTISDASMLFKGWNIDRLAIKKQ